MRLIRRLAILTLALPFVAFAQPDHKADLEAMKANVAKNVFAPEKERWEANITLWTLRIDGGGTIAKGDMTKAEAAFAKMQGNIAKLINPSEKERWMANRDLWQTTLGIGGVASSPSQLLSVMTHNVATITEPEEKERWTLNLNFWKAFTK